MGKAALCALAGLGGGALFERTPRSAWASENGGPGRRWGMLIDTRRCSEGCTACVAACHSSHNVPEFDNPRRQVSWMRLREGRPELCNHCSEPSCVRSCPTGSIFSRRDGIVAIDYHRCIGCRSCMLACPYGSVSYNWSDPREAIPSLTRDYPTRRQGVVEKCNFCADRLQRGLGPSCAAACPSKAITFGDLNDPLSSIRRLLESNKTMQLKAELGTRPSVFYII